MHPQPHKMCREPELPDATDIHCGRPVFGHGLCSAHYTRRRRAEIPMPVWPKTLPTERVCKVCGETQTIDRFPSYGQGWLWTCKVCVSQRYRADREANLESRREYARNWYADNTKKVAAYQRKTLATNPVARAKKRARLEAWAEAHPNQRIAQQAVRWAIEEGVLVRPNHCARCGAECKPHGHHHNGYAMEHWLDVEWLCVSCHYYANREKPSFPEIEESAS